jgi:YHS domain-containing protein
MSKSLIVLVLAILISAGIFVTSRLHGADPATPATPAVAPATNPSKPPAVDPKPVNTKCPVTGEDIDSKITTVYDGKTYAFCCEDCIKAFKKNPEKYTGGK